MRKLAPARVSYRDDFLISYQVYISTRDSKSQTLRMRYPFQSIGRPIFTPKRVVVSRLHDTAARFRTSLQCSRFHLARANGFNRESAMLKLPKRGGNDLFSA